MSEDHEPYPIAVVVERTGLSATAVRRWTDLLGSLLSARVRERRRGGHRAYTTRDVAVLQQVAALAQAGCKPDAILATLHTGMTDPSTIVTAQDVDHTRRAVLARVLEDSVRARFNGSLRPRGAGPLVRHLCALVEHAAAQFVADWEPEFPHREQLISFDELCARVSVAATPLRWLAIGLAPWITTPTANPTSKRPQHAHFGLRDAALLTRFAPALRGDVAWESIIVGVDRATTLSDDADALHGAAVHGHATERQDAWADSPEATTHDEWTLLLRACARAQVDAETANDVGIPGVPADVLRALVAEIRAPLLAALHAQQQRFLETTIAERFARVAALSEQTIHVGREMVLDQQRTSTQSAEWVRRGWEEIRSQLIAEINQDRRTDYAMLIESLSMPVSLCSDARGIGTAPELHRTVSPHHAEIAALHAIIAAKNDVITAKDELIAVLRGVTGA